MNRFTFVAELDVKVAGMAGVRQCYPHEVDALVIQIETHSYLVSDANMENVSDAAKTESIKSF